MKKICVLLLCAVLLSGTVGNYIYPSISVNEVQASVAISPEIVGAFSQWLYSLFLSADIVEYSSSWNERYVDMEKIMLSDNSMYDYAQYCEIVETSGGISLSYEDYIAYLNEHIYGADYVSGSGALQISEEGQRVFEVLEGGGGGSEPDNNEKPPSFQVSVGLSAMAGMLIGGNVVTTELPEDVLQKIGVFAENVKLDSMRYKETRTWELSEPYEASVYTWTFDAKPIFTGAPINDNYMVNLSYTYSGVQKYVQQEFVYNNEQIPVLLLCPYSWGSGGYCKYTAFPVVVYLKDGVPYNWDCPASEYSKHTLGNYPTEFGVINSLNPTRNYSQYARGNFGIGGASIILYGYSSQIPNTFDSDFYIETDFGLIIDDNLYDAIDRLNEYVLYNRATVFDNYSGDYVLSESPKTAYDELGENSLSDWTDALSQPFADGSLLIDGAEDIASLQDVTVDTLPEIYPEIYPEYQPDVDFSQYPEIYPDYDPVVNPNPVPAVKPDPERVVENVVENVIVPDGAIEPLPDVNPDIEPDIESDILDTGNLAGVTFSLSDYFPFCIPFDLIDAVRLLASKEAVAPRWEWTLDVDLFGYGVHHTFVLDMSQFEDLARVMRVFETLFFVVGLIVITRNIIRG